MGTQATVSHPRRGGARAVGGALGALAVSAADVVEEVIRTAAPVARDVRRRSVHRHPCECDDCNCHCTCCVCDVDLVVYTRLGERRVVPIEIENTRSRDREVKLDISPFTTRGGKPAPVTVGFAGEIDFTIAPCSRKAATLVVDVGGAELAGKGREGPHASRRRRLPRGGRRSAGRGLRHPAGPDRGRDSAPGLQPVRDRVRLLLLLSRAG